MAIIRWYDRPTLYRPWQEMERLQRDMRRLFSDMTGTGTTFPRAGVFPPVNISEDAENIYVRSELPGLSPDDLDISVEGDTLTIRGERKLTEAGEGVNYHRRERESGVFRRILTLPSRINPDQVQAAFKNGILKIILPKAEDARPKQIKVKTE